MATDLSKRYPTHPARRRVIIAVVTVLAAVGLAWTIWTGLVHANPEVSGRVKAWKVASDTQVDVTLTVDRTDPSRSYTCSVFAQSSNFERVGEVSVVAPPSTTRVTDLPVTIKTFRRATSVSYDKCVPA